MPKACYCPLIRRVFRKLKPKPNILCIIGNGFDLHHGIKSSYWDFREYIEKKDADLLEILEQYLDKDSLWSDFEATLGDLDTDSLIDDAGQYLTSYASDEWRESDNHNYEYEIEKVTSAITGQLKSLFTEWILSLYIPFNPGGAKLNLPKDANFINFNYTNTLEQIYHIPFNHILYIHNKALTPDSTLILGHNRKPKPHKPLTAYEIEQMEDEDPRVLGGDRIIDNYFAATYKSTEEIITNNHKFFTSLKDVTEVHILGHSLSDVDLKYFKEISRNTNRCHIKWKVSFFTLADISHHRKALANVGIPKSSISFYRLPAMYSIQRSLF